MRTLVPRPQILIGSAVHKKPNLIQNVPNRRVSPSLNFNNQREIITFGFSIPRPRLTVSGFKTAKPRLLKQVNTAKLKRPGILRPKPPSIRPPKGIGAAPLRRPM